MNVNEKGDLAVFKVCLAASEKGYIISRPLSDSSRYDLVIDTGKKLLKAQVKYANGKATQSTGSVRVCLEKKHGDKVLTYTSEEIDLLLVYVPRVDKICAFESDDFSGKRNLYIRVVPAKNKQSKGCIFLEDYLWN